MCEREPSAAPTAPFLCQDWEGEVRYAEYSRFAVANEMNSYRLSLGNYSGDVGNNALLYHNNTAFSTKDKDNDNCLDKCAQLRKGEIQRVGNGRCNEPVTSVRATQLCPSCCGLQLLRCGYGGQGALSAYQPCSLFLTPGGYWYNCCTDSNLNGVYYRQGNHKEHLDGITWYGWHGASYSLKRVEMKIRPEGFRP